MGRGTLAMGSGSVVTDPIDGAVTRAQAVPLQGSAFSVVLGPLGLRSSAQAQEAFRETAAQMKEVGAIPRNIEKWGDITDTEGPVQGAQTPGGPPDIRLAEDGVTFTGPLEQKDTNIY